MKKKFVQKEIKPAYNMMYEWFIHNGYTTYGVIKKRVY